MTDEVKNYVEEMGRTFEEFKSTIETRMTEIESKGQADPLTETSLQSKRLNISNWRKNLLVLRQC